MPELEEALQLGDEAFVAKYGFAKPPLDAPLVTHCLKGARAALAREKLVAQVTRGPVAIAAHLQLETVDFFVSRATRTSSATRVASPIGWRIRGPSTPYKAKVPCRSSLFINPRRFYQLLYYPSISCHHVHNHAHE